MDFGYNLKTDLWPSFRSSPSALQSAVESNSLSSVLLTMNGRGAYLPYVRHYACIYILVHCHNSLRHDSDICCFGDEERLLQKKHARNRILEQKGDIVRSEKTCMVWLRTHLGE